MRDRLRNWDSKITFFAFADIITAVSGMLIFITLLLATDLGQPSGRHSQKDNAELDQQLQEALRQQIESDAQNRRLQEVLATLESAPGLEKLEVDISSLRSQLSQEEQKQADLADRMARSRAAIEARDRTLGLTGLKDDVQRLVEEANVGARAEAKVRREMENSEQQVALVQSQLLKLREREGQIWLIPERSATSKEPLLVTVAGDGVTIERFDRPEERRHLDKGGVSGAFKSHLRQARALDQYVVFLIRPSGIVLFQDLVESAREMGFEVGFDALEEGQQIHFSTPPPVDATPPAIETPATPSGQKPTISDSGAAPQANAPTKAPLPKVSEAQPQPVTGTPPPRRSKTWWERILEWIGLR